MVCIYQAKRCAMYYFDWIVPACTLILIEILTPLEAFKNRLFYHILLIAPVNLKYSHAMQAKNEDFECTCS